MTKFKCLIAAAFALISVTADAATIYECRAYNGSNFFSNNVCSQSKGIGIINHTVPDNMTFDQQVKIVEAAKAKEAARGNRKTMRDGRNQRLTTQTPINRKRHSANSLMPQ